MTQRTKLILGTRSSPLALAQTDAVRAIIHSHHPELDLQIQTISTKGDRVLDQALSKIGDRGLFTNDLEQAMRAGTIDVAIHSLKDMPTRLPPGLDIAAISSREDPHDALVMKSGCSGTIDSLPPGSVIGGYASPCIDT
eukprot:TRINITY_DN12834_c0_g1_i5.p1 TRINITY_DN12834_c0_g1~~TRINITY_DN12834_c0_g1_i5.p1  ORF type:complete len:147 (+),score=4.46 TRINITY_DN12834_c0_g1_i5:25-441(+)